MSDGPGRGGQSSGPVARLVSVSVFRMGKFAMVGVVNTAVDLTIFAMLVSVVGWPLLPANVISYGTGIVNSFLLNKYWTFRDPTPLSRSLRPGARFFVINILSLVISTVTVVVLGLVLEPLVAKVLSLGVVFAWNYGLSNRFVFSAARTDQE